MKIFKFSLVLFFILLLTNNYSQNKSFIFLPDSLQFIPLKANHQEARIGVLYYPKNGHLKVDVGNNIDLLQFLLSENITANVGIEFMAYAYSTNYQGKRLQIDAIDGFFGGHASADIKLAQSTLKTRFRIIHNSAHFVDGHYDNINNKWKDDILPIPFTQDFGELTAAHNIDKDYGGLMYYGSIAYATLVRPSLIKKYSFNAGIELHSNKIFGSVFDREVNVFIASHNKYAGMPEYKISSNNMVGVKFGEWYGKGIVFYLSYYYGNNVFNEYYYERDKWFGIGFFVDYL